jgi:predicted negative regulator of RcsB-dependent stress response
MNEVTKAAGLTFAGFILLAVISFGWQAFQESRKQAELRELCKILEVAKESGSKEAIFARQQHYLECE